MESDNPVKEQNSGIRYTNSSSLLVLFNTKDRFFLEINNGCFLNVIEHLHLLKYN